MRVWAPFLPLGLLAVTSAGVAALHDKPARLTLDAGWLGPSWDAPFGYGEGGLALLPFVAHGVSRALLLALTVAVLGFVVGTVVGAAAGALGGRFERWTLRGCDLVQAFPSFLLALAVLAAVRVPTRAHLVAVFCLTAWAPFARLAASEARVLAASQFVEAAKALGRPPWLILLRHVIPNLLGPVSVQTGTTAAGVVLGETALAYVGLGAADGVTLGAVLEQGTVGMLRAPHVLFVGAVAVTLTSGALQLASEGLRRVTQGR